MPPATEDFHLKLAMYQGSALPADKQGNLCTIERVVASVKSLGVDIVVFPELFTTGYNQGERLKDMAEPVNGKSVQALRDIAIKYDTALICGFAEDDNGTLYNSAIVLDKNGKQLALHRKVFLFGYKERQMFKPGESFPAFTFEGVRCGLSICYDIEFPETGRALAAHDVQVIFNPTANMEPYDQAPLILAPARALENNAVVVYANYCGVDDDLEYTGLSAVIGPDGKDIARAGRGDCVLIADLTPALAAAQKKPLSTQLTDLGRVRTDLL